MEIETSHPFMAALQPLSVGQDAINDVVQEVARTSVTL
jgi:methyl coenzyme M reductase alpha subunit